MRMASWSRRTFPWLLATLMVPALLSSGAAAAKSAPPPLLDRELFFGDPEISQAQISPDGKFIAFVKPLEGTRNVWVKKTEEPFDKARPLTADTKRPIPAYFWSRDSRHILFVQDDAGDENYNVWAVDPAATPPEGGKVPSARNITALEKVRALIYAVPRKTPDLLYIGLNDRDPAWHDLYRLNIASGERTLIRKNTERIASWFFDLAGQLRLAVRITQDGSTEILKVTDEALEVVYTCSVFESCGPARFHKDGQRVYMITNKGDDVDLTRLILFDPRDGTTSLVESDPLNRADFGAPIFSDVTDELVGTSYEDDKTRLYWRDETFADDYAFLEKKLGDKDVLPNSSTADERLWLVTATSDVEPGERYLYDRATKKLTRQYRVFDKLPRESLATMEPVRYPSSDGLEIPAYLTLPRGIPATKLPLVVIPHGGPWARDSWGYDAFAQFLANRGYAVLQPNFRGSVGYGKKFLNAGNNEWGQKMQDDLTWGLKYLVGRGIVDPKRAGIMGGSYGGYATLAGLAFTPDTWAAGVSIVGPSNLITLLDSIPPYWESIRTVFHHRMGDPETPEGLAQLQRQSPLNSADKIKTPLLVVQGANDPRVKPAESDQIVVALRERKFPVEYLIADDEGHGFARPVNNMAMFASAEKFLAKHLGGRFQESMPAEVAARLGEITVDVKTVRLPTRIDPVAVTAPTPAHPLSPGTFRFQRKIEVGGDSFDLSVERVIREEGDQWIVTESTDGDSGAGTEVANLAKDSLAVRRRTATQGPISMEFRVEESKAEGEVRMGDQQHKITVDLGGVIFADGPGGDESVATLPLAEGFTSMFRNLDIQRGKERLMELSVAALESVTVPAGTFEAWRVEIRSTEGEPDRTSIWIAKDSRRVLKSSVVLPQMNGAVVTTEALP